ncbi:putative substrate-binding domain protein [Lysobacter gummosus]|nr:putative substrate-binding domain protein [Lysobacter gummosus]
MRSRASDIAACSGNTSSPPAMPTSSDTQRIRRIYPYKL